MFLGLLSFIRPPIIRGKVISVTLKAVWEFSKHDPAVSLSPSQAYHAWETAKQTPPRASTLCYFTKGQKGSNFPKAILYKTAFTYS
ncbi:hypothetical protein JHK86_044158 [Glycine max]|nr:hypothetical protein JHK86_044158 [Glycine max]